MKSPTGPTKIREKKHESHLEYKSPHFLFHSQVVASVGYDLNGIFLLNAS